MNSNAVLERHPELYFNDGDIVLAVKQAGNPPQRSECPTKYTLFRVHRFLLKHHSATFTNFLADANADPAEVYDGVPLAEMHGDQAEDFALLLNYLYNPSSLVSKRNDPNTPLTVSGAVRLADKYLIEPLHRCLVQQVIEDWPATLDEYDIKQGEIESLRNVAITNYDFKYTPAGPHRGRISDVIPEPASAIVFAREFACPQILPAAFYRLSLIPVSFDWTQSDSISHSPLARWEVLDKDSLLQCMHGSQELAQYYPVVEKFMAKRCYQAFWLEDDSEMDTGPYPCHQFITRLFEINFKHRPKIRPDLLRFLTKCLDFHKTPGLSEEQFPEGLCGECQDTLYDGLVQERKRIWAKLPQWFKLE